MTIQDELELSYYEDVGPYGEDGQMRLVKDNRDGRYFVKKTRTVYDKTVYAWIFLHPVPGIPRIRLLVEDQDKLILIEENIDGVTLERMIRQFPAQITEDAVIKWMRQLLALLKYFHTAVPPIVHRDLKPENFVISSVGDLYLIDCNTARLYDGNADRDTRLLGTAGYAAPEQYGFGESDQRTDIYAFGMILNYLLTGQLSRQAIKEGKWNHLIRKCVELDPQNRYQDVFALERAFEAVVRAIPKAVPESGTARISLFRKDGEKDSRIKVKRDGTGETAKVHPDSRDGLIPDGTGDWRPPGVRGAGAKVRSLAIVCYALLAIYIMGALSSYKGHGIREFVADSLLMVVAAILPILFLSDYHGFQHLFPGARSDKKPVRIVMLFVWAFVLFIICPIISVIIMNV
ncbi:MAG: protein kinase [Eubacterium sp.]|nr:protein kinase [Eubacterium sp.]